MAQYYVRYWKRWRDADHNRWEQTYLRLLSTLAAAQEPLTLRQLCAFAAIEEKPELRVLLEEHWRPFLASDLVDGSSSYRLYHASLREFLDGRIATHELMESEQKLAQELASATVQAHARIAARYMDAWGGMQNGA